MIRQMSGRFGDGEIAATLNRLSLRTGAGNGWNAQRVYGLRRQHECQTLPVRRTIGW